MKQIYVLYGGDNTYKTTITTVAKYIMTYPLHKETSVNIDTLLDNWDVLKISQFHNITTFAKTPKKMYSVITLNDNILQEEDKTLKEIERPKFVKWAEAQKEMLGSNLWAKHVIEQFKTVPNFKKYWIGDLRFKEEYKALQEFKNTFDSEINIIKIVLSNDLKSSNKHIIDFNKKPIILNINVEQNYNKIIKDIYLQVYNILTND